MTGGGEIRCEGFVLAGGRSSRMGTDKALLEFEGATLVQAIARRVAAAAGHVTLIGQPDRYASLGLPVIADAIEDCGPLGGLCTALQAARTDWNLLVACDMPEITVEFLRNLIEAADEVGREEAREYDAVVPRTARGLQPLCALYHRRILPLVSRHIANKSLRMHDLLDQLRVLPQPVADASILSNVNTVLEWETQRGAR